MKGKDAGKSGTILQVFPKEQRVIVEGLNILTKYLKPRKRGEKGERIQFNAPLFVSNVMILCSKCGRPSRIGIRRLPDRKRERYCHQCDQTI